ncbi:MAG: beta-eliminating lyase-related protein [Caldilineaceae bacterium]
MGDESYAGAAALSLRGRGAEDHRFGDVIPTSPSGRAAERILFGSMLKPGDVVPNNTHFDTTRANVEYPNAQALDIPVPEARRPELILPSQGTSIRLRWNGPWRNRKSGAAGHGHYHQYPGGGQPVSMANIRAASAICRPRCATFLDAPLAENAWFIKQRVRRATPTPHAAGHAQRCSAMPTAAP